jgi:hypothetical protein
MSKYGLNTKNYHERQKDAPEFLQVHNRLASRIVYFLRFFSCGVYVANESEQQEKKFDFKTKMKDETVWTAWDVKVALNLPKQFSGPLTELNCIFHLLTWQGLERLNDHNHIFWLLAQTRENIAEAEYDEVAKRIAKRVIAGDVLENIHYCPRGANKEDHDRHRDVADKTRILQRALLETNRPLASNNKDGLRS